MLRKSTGNWVPTTIGARAFIPHPLPPDPPLHLGEGLSHDLDSALLAVGRLDSVTVLLPNAALLVYLHSRKEALLSSQIDSKALSLLDLLLLEIGEAPEATLDTGREVSSYVAALEHGIRRLRKGFPVSGRLLRELHGILLAGENGAGEFRNSQNWIGGSRVESAVLVPSPPAQLPECMAALDRFLHDDPERFPVLIKAALAHAQFETLHPFMRGNGRLGRLLIMLLFLAEGALREPLLYLSLYLDKHRTRYFDLLQRTRTEGDWESWLNFFLTGVREAAEQALASARHIIDLFQRDRIRIRALGRVAGSAALVHQALQKHPVTSIKRLASQIKLTIPTVTAALHALEKSGIAREITGRRRNRLYAYSRYLEILSEA